MRKLIALLALSVLAVPLAASADQQIAINLRGGAAKPWGDAAKDAPMSDAVDWAFPLQADLAFRFTKQIGVGAYVRYAPVLLASTLDNACKAGGVSCSGSDLAFGLLGEYRFGERLDGGGWVGLNLGWEIDKLKGNGTATLSGFEGGVQVGYDMTLAGITIGPFLHANLGRFSKLDAGGVSGSITDKAMHGWFGLGIRLGILI